MTGAVVDGRAAHVCLRRSPGGFNLLPWRPSAIRRLRRRRLLEWFAAALAGCACALGVVLWQSVERGGLDARRAALERSLATWRTPLAEAQQLASEAQARRAGEALARRHARAAVRLFALADALASDVPPGVGLQQLTQHADETDLQASAADESAVAAWLGRLRTLPDVEDVSVGELKRGAPAGAARENAQDGGPIRVAAHLVWQGASAGATPPAFQAHGHPVSKEAK